MELESDGRRDYEWNGWVTVRVRVSRMGGLRLRGRLDEYNCSIYRKPARKRMEEAKM